MFPPATGELVVLTDGAGAEAAVTGKTVTLAGSAVTLPVATGNTEI